MNSLIWFIIAAFVVLAIASGLVYLVWRSPKRLSKSYFTQQWREIQGMCKDKSSWPDAINRSDDLLCKALRKKRFKGKTMGERMVSAQRVFTNNDSLWFAHNLSKKLREEGVARLKEAEVKDALIGFRQALKDLGVLDNGESRSS